MSEKTEQDKFRYQKVMDLEKKFCLVFPKSYKKYVLELDFAPTELDQVNFTNQYKQNIDLESINKKLRNELNVFPPLPEYIFAISDGHDDNYICFDLRKKRDKEYKLCNWSVQSIYNKNELISKYPSGMEEQANYYIISDSFCEYVKSMLGLKSAV